MIELTCTSCHATLHIDDGFAGGVCRCQYCGTIQTVPTLEASRRRAVSPVGASSVAPAPAGSKVLYPGSPPARGNELAGLAQAVASSGLSGTGLKHLQHQGHGVKSSAGNMVLPLIIAGVVLGAILLGVVAYWLLTRTPALPTSVQIPTPPPAQPSVLPPAPIAPAPAPHTPTPPVKAERPVPRPREIVQPKPPEVVAPPKPVAQQSNFMGVAIDGPSVIYLLDRGQGTRDTFDAIKGAAMMSIQSLGKARKFQIIFWERDGKAEACPAQSLSYANDAAIDATKKSLAETFAGGQTQIDGAIEKAIAQNPAEIVVATGKYGLDEQFIKVVLDRRKASTAKIHTFSLGRSGSPDTLKSLAAKTGGQFKELSPADLQDYEANAPN